jgi:hypothetical protein
MSKPFVYTGICEASAAVALDEDHFVVASDETNTFQLYRRGTTRPIRPLKFKKFIGQQKSDIEAAARIGDRVYWMSSFSRPGEDSNARDRSVLVASRIVHTPNGPRLYKVGEPFLKLRRYLKQELKIKGRDINIEGLAGSPEGHLLIGFRAPLKDGRAYVLRLKNPIDVTELDREPVFGNPQILDLDGNGIRSLDWTGLNPPLYFILAGSSPNGDEDLDKKGKFTLYSWTGSDAQKPLRFPVELPEDFTAEALIPYPEKGMVQILSDDKGKRNESDLKKKNRRFRTVDVSYKPE